MLVCDFGNAVGVEKDAVARCQVHLDSRFRANGLGQGAEARAFTALGAAGRLQPGTAIPPPSGVFPRYVEPDDAETKAKPPKSKDKRKPATS